MAQTLNYDPKPLTFPGLRLPPAPTTPPFFNGDPGQGDPRNGAVASGWQRTQWGVGATPPQSSRPPPLLIWAGFYALGWLASALALECVKGGWRWALAHATLAALVGTRGFLVDGGSCVSWRIMPVESLGSNSL